ncbi:DUF2752 domain-containing protein [Umezawaea endophytica]|uniref:DUF2752 domain-containing protein n=1 Tax=Umezawaea endophytica TaxID=1654476 RepID=A0A9X3A3M3_9PSEU|nr:DUF2752 domain-containing protein [Umezawaea endophytica]MCS7481889.1 DUF2752 domain-containing protein [Umezawaea endophytica]
MTVVARLRKVVTGPIGALLAASGAAAAVYFTDPTRPGSWLPRCPFNWLTGLDCPACGSTRMVYSLLHGDLAAAWHFNPVMLIAGLPLFAWLWLRWFQADRRNTKPPQVSPRVGQVVIVVGLVWGVVRNLVA